MATYHIICGGVYSGLGKGVVTASLAKIYKDAGDKINLLKCDPYLNINTANISVEEHGQNFVCKDGSVLDMDLGHYERFTGIIMSKKNSINSGQLYTELLQNEKLQKSGKTIQVIPHLTNLIIEKFKKIGKNKDSVFIEIGGTVGDLESCYFFEAIRQFQLNNDVKIWMVAPLVPDALEKEYKTKPIQHAVANLGNMGLKVDYIICRCYQFDEEVFGNSFEEERKKLSIMTNIPVQNVLINNNQSSIYFLPEKLAKQLPKDITNNKNICNYQYSFDYNNIIYYYINKKDRMNYFTFSNQLEIAALSLNACVAKEWSDDSHVTLTTKYGESDDKMKILHKDFVSEIENGHYYLDKPNSKLVKIIREMLDV